MSASKFQYNYLKLPLPAPDVSQGFTAVILTYDRVDMLYQVIRGIAKAPSLAKVLVLYVYTCVRVRVCVRVCVELIPLPIDHFILLQILIIWNNLDKSPPPCQCY